MSTYYKKETPLPDLPSVFQRATLEPMKRYAFLHKNFRALNPEKKVIFVANAATLLFCLFPWYTQYPVYGDGEWTNAFGGGWFLIGSMIFLCALLVVLHIGDQLMETKKIKLPLEENYLFLGLSVQTFIFLILAWSVLEHGADTAYNAEVRYGIFVCFLSQFVALLASVLRIKDDKKETAQSFFSHPEPKKKKTVHEDHHHPQNLLQIDDHDQ